MSLQSIGIIKPHLAIPIWHWS